MKSYIKLLIVSFTFVLAIFSCKKDPGLISAPIAGADSIYHKVLSPFVVLNPITNLVAHGSGCGYIFNPYDSLATFDLDLDSNGVNDLHFASKSYYEFHSASSPCVNYLRSTNINAINATDSLGFIPVNYLSYKTFYYSYGDTVGNKSKFLNQSNFSYYLYLGMTNPMAIHGGDFYLPLKRIVNNKTMYGWMKIDTIGYGGIIIKEYAINKTNGNKIICGQTH